MLNLVLLIADEGLEEDQFLLELVIVNALTGSQGFVIKTLFVEGLTVVDLVVVDFGVEADELLIDSGGVGEVLVLVVAIGQQRQGSGFGAKL